MKMIDIHTHILPSIDDGACDLNEAYELIQLLYDQNVQTAVCTPHFNPTNISLDEFIHKRDKSLSLMAESKIALLPASETVLHPYLFHHPDIDGLCIRNTRYLLIEMPFIKKWDNSVYEMIERLISFYNVIPIIAHIERYPAIKNNAKIIEKIKEFGCVIQLNTTTIIDKKNSKRALHYIKSGYIDVLGSDCHNVKTRYPIINDALEMVKKNLGEQYKSNLIENAQYIINGTELKKKITYILE
jgi:protein-tyrosine phosphatase